MPTPTVADDIRDIIARQGDDIKAFTENQTEKLSDIDARVREIENRGGRPGNDGSREGELIQNTATGQLARTLPASASVRSFAGSSAPKAETGISVGSIIRAMATGKATPEIRASLNEGTDSQGGYAVPEEYSTDIIDQARARSVVIRAGAQTVPIGTEKTKYLRILADPVPEWRLELGEVAESEPTFGAMTFTARSLAVIVRASRELLEDSPNAESAINTSVAGGFAYEFDRVGLFGSGVAPEPLGIVNTPGINGVAVSGAIDSYAAILGARRAILSANGNEPTAVIMNSVMDETVAGLTATDGQPLLLPRAIEDLPFLVTSLGGASLNNKAVVGDFTQLWYGMRIGLRIEPLRELYAKTMEVAFLCFMRFDVAVVRPASFSVITVTP